MDRIRNPAFIRIQNRLGITGPELSEQFAYINSPKLSQMWKKLQTFNGWSGDAILKNEDTRQNLKNE